MPGDRIQRQIDRLLDDAEAASDARDWVKVRDRAEAVLELSPDNLDAAGYRDAARRALVAAAAVRARQGAWTGGSPPVPLRYRTNDPGAAVGSRPPPGSDGTVTLMFSDIEGSTPLNERLGDETWMLVLEAHNHAIERAVRRSGGRVVKKTGDGYMVAFANPHAGVRCARAIQDSFATPPPALHGIRVRIGLHTGRAIRQGRDFLGREVNYAARVASVASGGEVLVSSVVRERTAAEGWSFGACREVVLRGFEGSHPVWPVVAS